MEKTDKEYNIDNMEQQHDEENDQELEELNANEESDEEQDQQKHADNFDHGKEEEEQEASRFFLTEPVRMYFDKQDLAHPDNKGAFYMLMAGIMFAFVMFVYLLRLSHVPPIQFLFIVLLCVFLWNYTVMRDASVTPFVVGEENTSSKIGSIIGLTGLICTCYAMEFMPIESSMTLLFWSALFGIVIDKVVRKAEYTMNELLFVLLAVVGATFALRPSFLFGGWSQPHYLGHWGKNGNLITRSVSQQSRILQEMNENNLNSTATDVIASDDGSNMIILPLDDLNNSQLESNPMKGMLFGILGSFLFALAGSCWRKLEQHDYMTITHIFLLFFIVFTPAFFPMEGVTRPSIIDWVTMMALSCPAFLGLECFIKSCQAEKTGKALSVFTVSLLGSTIFEIFALGGFAECFWGIVGSGIICVSVFMLLMTTSNHSNQLNGVEEQENNQQNKKFLDEMIED